MKKVSLYLAVLFTFVLFMASCDREDYFEGEGDYNGLNDDWGDEPANDGGEGNDHGHQGGESDFVILTTYSISGNQITKIKDYDVAQQFQFDQDDVGKHQKMWDYYASLIPLENRGYITEFVVFHGEGNLAGYVEPIDENDLSKWRMGLAIDVTGDLDNRDIKEEFAYVAIHEFAHVLTLNSSQVDVGGSEGNCANFHTGEGCSKSNSYINAFFELGWKDIYDEFRALGESDLHDFYQKYSDRFVTDYAASNPGEDIAEVFSVFVTQDNAPSGNSIADKKINLMYNYPELVSLRNEIRNDPTLREIQPGSWVKTGRKQRVFNKKFF